MILNKLAVRVLTMGSLWGYIATMIAVCYCINVVISSGCLSENDDERYPQTIQSDLYRGQQIFTVAVLDAINKATPNENIFFSPYSTYHALLLAYFGARNDTEAELADVLNLQWAKNKNHVRHAYRMEKIWRSMRSRDSAEDFSSADRIYLSQDTPINRCIQELFPEEVERVNFRTDPEGSRSKINSWVANITRSEIPEILSEGDVDSETNLILTNAAYFKGQWESKFDPNDTTMDVFYISPSKQTFVNMMHRRGTYNLAIDEYLRAHILEMPYLTNNNSEVSMVIILPPFFPDSLEGVLERLNPDSLSQALKEGMPREINVSLPRFEFEQNIELLPILEKIGVRKLFQPSADLSGLSPNKNISLGDAKHVAKIKVDEEGSTAAAATVLFTFRSARPVEPTKFECNHPFLFLIYDHKSQAVLFTGIYRDPVKHR